MQFKLGDRVRWTSQSAGFSVEKTGEIIEVVPPKTAPTTKLDRPGLSRDHESYVVRARKPDGRSSKYWPKVKYLELVREPVPQSEPLRGSGVQMM
jgi:hypothetical protein